MYRLLYPLRYLVLRNEAKRRLVFVDAWPVLLLAVVLAGPFIATDANYFGLGGFLDRFGAFSSVLTGFYIAALVAVATFASMIGSLDEIIEVGPVYSVEIEEDEEGERRTEFEPLSRRQYVCSIFGYLAFMSLALSVGTIAAVIIAPSFVRLANYADGTVAVILLKWLPAGAIILLSTVISHMVITTCFGLHYLIDKLYTTKPAIPDLPADHQMQVRPAGEAEGRL